MSDTHKMRVAHQHNRVMPSRRRFDESLMLGQILYPNFDFITPDEIFPVLDLRDLVDGMDNEGEE